MKKIRRYELITGSDPAKFIQQVNDLIADGYEPLGGVSTIADKKGVVFSQAMFGESAGSKSPGGFSFIRPKSEDAPKRKRKIRSIGEL